MIVHGGNLGNSSLKVAQLEGLCLCVSAMTSGLEQMVSEFQIHSFHFLDEAAGTKTLQFTTQKAD